TPSMPRDRSAIVVHFLSLLLSLLGRLVARPRSATFVPHGRRQPRGNGGAPRRGRLLSSGGLLGGDEAFGQRPLRYSRRLLRPGHRVLEHEGHQVLATSDHEPLRPP